MKIRSTSWPNEKSRSPHSCSIICKMLRKCGDGAGTKRLRTAGHSAQAVSHPRRSRFGHGQSGEATGREQIWKTTCLDAASRQSRVARCSLELFLHVLRHFTDWNRAPLTCGESRWSNDHLWDGGRIGRLKTSPNPRKTDPAKWRRPRERVVRPRISRSRLQPARALYSRQNSR